MFFKGHVTPENLYQQVYFRGAEYRDYLADKDILQRNFHRRIEILHRLKPSGQLLEIGAAYGFFLELAQQHWQVQGLDIAVEASAYARDVLGLPVITGDFLALPDNGERFDIICIWDTIEHLQHPCRVLEKAARWLRDDGILVVTTGDIDSRMARVQKERWRLIHPPTHLFYFSTTTLSRAVIQAGLQVSEISHVGYFRSYRAMLYGLLALERDRPSWLYSMLTLGNSVDFPIYLNMRDIMMLIARKPIQENWGEN